MKLNFVLIASTLAFMPMQPSLGKSFSDKILELRKSPNLNRASFEELLKSEKRTKINLVGSANIMVDDTDPKNPKETLYIQNIQQNIRLDLLDSTLDRHSLLGKKIKVTGTIEQGSLMGFSEVIADEIALPKTNPKMLILLFSFKNSPKVQANASDIKKAVFKGAFNQFFKKISDQRIEHSGDVYGFYSLNRNGEDDGSGNMCYVSQNELSQAITHYQIDPNQYDQITVLTNCAEYFTVGGFAFLFPSSVLNQTSKKFDYIQIAVNPIQFNTQLSSPYIPGWNSLISILVHERGHNYGLLHSNGLDCGSSTQIQSCSSVEYGNTFDRMGGPDGSNLFNAHQQVLAKFKKDSELLHVTAPGNYMIDPLGSELNGRKIAAYIHNFQKPEEKLFMLEYRTPEGFDKPLSDWLFRFVPEGALLYSTYFSSGYGMALTMVSNEFRIIDPNPTTDPWHNDVAYDSLRGSFTDARTGIRITTLPPSSGKLAFSVEQNPEWSVCNHTTQSTTQMTSSPYLTRYFYKNGSVPISSNNTSGNSGPGNLTGLGMNPFANIELPTHSTDIKKQHVVLLPGDYFKLKIDTLDNGESLLCGRTNLQLKIQNFSQFLSYMPTQNISVLYYSFAGMNINASQTFSAIFKVPFSELNKDRIFQISIQRMDTGETITKELHLHIRNSLSAAIEMDATKQP